MGTHTVLYSSFFVFSLQAASVLTTITMALSDFAAVGDDGWGTTAPNPGREERVVAAKMSDTEDLTTPAICGGASSPSLTSAKREKVETEVKKVVTIKEEEEEDGEDEGLCKIIGDGSHSSSTSVSVVLPKPLEGLHESGPPPFLKKTFEMVDNPETDSMVSWSKGRDSFIVWDSHEFSKNMLPKYFKHSNFSSFIRQLNTYGFRKIDPDRWEFANEGFQRGKKNLLKRIKRRSRYNKHQNVATSSVDSTKVGLEAEFESLKNDQKVLKMEILNLRQQQADSNNQLSVVRERIRTAECKQLQMLILFAKVRKNPGFIQQLIHKRKQQGWLDGNELCKKRRLLHTQFPQSLTSSAHTGQTVNCRNQAQEQLATMQTELAEILPKTNATNPVSKLCPAPLNDEFCSHIQDPVANLMCATDTEDASFVYDIMSEKLMDDSSVGENPVEEDLELDVNDSKFYLELEGLIGRPGTWGTGYVTELVEHASCVG